MVEYIKANVALLVAFVVGIDPKNNCLHLCYEVHGFLHWDNLHFPEVSSKRGDLTSFSICKLLGKYNLGFHLCLKCRITSLYIYLLFCVLNSLALILIELLLIMYYFLADTNIELHANENYAEVFTGLLNINFWCYRGILKF